MSPGETTLHATCIVLGEDGILIRGASGSGKSSLALDLIARTTLAKRFARLVSDDRVHLSGHSGRLVARAVASIAGRVEIRGIGIVEVPHEAACILRLVIDLDEAPPRMPATDTRRADILGVSLPRLTVDPNAARRILDLIGTREPSPLWRLNCDKDDALVTIS